MEILWHLGKGPCTGNVADTWHILGGGEPFFEVSLGGGEEVFDVGLGGGEVIFN